MIMANEKAQIREQWECPRRRHEAKNYIMSVALSAMCMKNTSPY